MENYPVIMQWSEVPSRKSEAWSSLGQFVKKWSRVDLVHLPFIWAALVHH